VLGVGNWCEQATLDILCKYWFSYSGEDFNWHPYWTETFNW